MPSGKYSMAKDQFLQSCRILITGHFKFILCVSTFVKRELRSKAHTVHVYERTYISVKSFHANIACYKCYTCKTLIQGIHAYSIGECLCAHVVCAFVHK